MPRRVSTLILLVLPLLVGLLLIDTGLHDRPGEVNCPGEIVSGYDGEETPGPMRPGDACAVLHGSTAAGERTYQEQRAAQLHGAHRMVWIGGAVCGGVLLGSAALLVRVRRRRAGSGAC